ncbi:MAG TPA: prolipoprotein diacylglyceryl transferase [Caldilineaceae bacterium]|nr:prolipoprotein diacylglyceryl transferase [Caldilineaceae bacterium]
MYPTIPFGPLALPTGPIILLLATMLGLEMAGRFGRRLGLAIDDVWNTGLLALAAGLIVARLWNIVTFWPIYLDQPGLVLSLRPSGFVLWPGLIAALVAAYANLLRRSLDPLRMAAAFAVGAVAAGIAISAGAYLTGSVVGVRSDVPWALAYFGERRHPVALYQAAGLWLLFVTLLLVSRPHQPGRTVLYAVLGYSLIRLFTDAFVDEPMLIGQFRLSQVIALAAALVCVWRLAQQSRQSEPASPASEEMTEPS